MDVDLNQRAQLKFTGDPVEAPADWRDAEHFPTLQLALEAALERMDQAPWIRAGARTIRPADIDDLWKVAFRPLSD